MINADIEQGRILAYPCLSLYRRFYSLEFVSYYRDFSTDTMAHKIHRFLKVIFATILLSGALGLGFAWSEIIKLTPYDPLAVKLKLEPKLTGHFIADGAPIFIRIFKETAELEVWMKNVLGQWVLFKNYPICYFSGKLGPKLKEGDLQSPEGFYTVSKKQMNPNSNYHLSFNLGFPNKFDRVNGRTGSYLMVHGNCISVGCYAMTDGKVEEIYTLANESFNEGQETFQVHVFPFRMSDENMLFYGKSKWIGFWKNLKQGYDYFEQHNEVPKITVSGKQYEIEANLPSLDRF